MNRTGRRYIGHFDVALKNRVASLRERATQALRPDATDYVSSWVNLDNYQQTNEPFGLLPFDGPARERGSMLPYDPAFLKEHPRTRHQFLSNLQGTRFAVLPVHTREERTLFQSFAHSSPLFSGPQHPDFTAIASLFNTHANGADVFYKVILCCRAPAAMCDC